MFHRILSHLREPCYVVCNTAIHTFFYPPELFASLRYNRSTVLLPFLLADP